MPGREQRRTSANLSLPRRHPRRRHLRSAWGRGLDTVEANLALGFADDERDYAIAAHMIASLDARSVKLMTNNPQKIQQRGQYGIQVHGRIPHVIPPNPHNRFYLETKVDRSGHWIDLDGKPHLPEQGDAVVIEGMAADPGTDGTP